MQWVYNLIINPKTPKIRCGDQFGASGSSGSSTSPSSDTYCGAYAFSEPETAAVARFVDEHPAIRAGVDFHTYGPLILWPWYDGFDITFGHFSRISRAFLSSTPPHTGRAPSSTK